MIASYRSLRQLFPSEPMELILLLEFLLGKLPHGNLRFYERLKMRFMFSRLSTRQVGLSRVTHLLMVP